MERQDNVRPAAALIASLSLAYCAAASAISPSEFDAFETGSVLSWFTLPRQTAPTLVGVCASGSTCLQIKPGVSAPPARQIVANETQWTGDYFEAGIKGVGVFLDNSGAVDLEMRIGITNDPDGSAGAQRGTCYVSRFSLPLPALDSQRLRFGINTQDMTLSFDGNNCGGSESLQEVMSNVTQLRIYSAPDRTGGDPPTWVPMVAASKLFLDNIAPIVTRVDDMPVPVQAVILP